MRGDGDGERKLAKRERTASYQRVRTSPSYHIISWHRVRTSLISSHITTMISQPWYPAPAPAPSTHLGLCAVIPDTWYPHRHCRLNHKHGLPSYPYIHTHPTQTIPQRMIITLIILPSNSVLGSTLDAISFLISCFFASAPLLIDSIGQIGFISPISLKHKARTF